MALVTLSKDGVISILETIGSLGKSSRLNASVLGTVFNSSCRYSEWKINANDV